VHFQIYCHEDSKCSLKVVGQSDVREFDSILTAVAAAREMSETGESLLTVYSTLGTVIFETLV
jgi:hypothetical protein